MSDDVTVPEIDMAYEEDTLGQAVQNVEARFEIVCEVIKEVGPAGGSPVVSLTGPRDKIEDALRHGWNLDDDELAEYLLPA